MARMASKLAEKRVRLCPPFPMRTAGASAVHVIRRVDCMEANGDVAEVFAISSFCADIRADALAPKGTFLPLNNRQV